MLRADIRAAGVRGVPPVESSRPVCVKGRKHDTNPHRKVCANVSECETRRWVPVPSDPQCGPVSITRMLPDIMRVPDDQLLIAL